MPKEVLLDEFHLSVFAPRKLSAEEYSKIHKVLNRRRFRTLLNRALRTICRRFRSLAKVRIKLSQ